MKSRAEIKKAHEDAVLRAGLTEHNRLHALKLEVISRPEPPDAILSDGSMITWMEVTAAFFSNEWAKDLSSYNSIKGHIPMESGLYMGMDKQFAVNFCDLLQQKAGKVSYQPLLKRYGPGILVVSLESPWLDAGTIDEIEEEWTGRGRPAISKTFAHVYLRHRAGGGDIVRLWNCD
ncbi:hypothetical protein GJ700_28760 [Duganella sp. FT92W]|uniref:Uncharacterized protein n=1 Tax=Pseudoduganella rivuli TaxID=2666085 RepID=A0A7X2ITF5_9BURK|nr:hypothetical protein [Pseudoduganella rivuli]MRV75714.1 hypothetical protein [Pseudoduganella rivuli]